ncbi:MAG: TonB family protein [Rhodocyclales bacterium GT-UBC]|nr:MAG: TonB family protein [Rhodocyclales bacterium GT-UBC]
MSYAEQQRNPRKHLVGLVAVLGFHVVLVYALANGLGRKVIEVLKAPLNVSIVEEVKTLPPPPPPPKVVVARTKSPPPPAYAPPVEVPVNVPVQPTVTTSSQPPAPTPVAPAAPAAPAAPPAVNIAVACPNHVDVRSQVPFPRQAERLGLSGEVVIEFTVGVNGEVKNVTVAQSTNSVFNAAATAAVAQLRCNGQGHEARVRVPFSFRHGG